MCFEWSRSSRAGAAIDVYSFALFAGAPVASVAARRAAQAVRLELAHLGQFCICGFATFSHGHLHDGTRCITCVNSACPPYDVPMLPPRLAVARADPAVVRRVRAEEEAAERERHREEKAMRELHSGVANRQEVARAGQKASTPIGQALRVRTPARFSRLTPLSRGRAMRR